MKPMRDISPVDPTPAAQAASLQQVASRDGTPIAYWRSGVGTPLLLVHGTTADHTRWARVVPVLEDAFTVCDGP